MDTSNIINLVLLVVTALGVVFAGFQARAAREANRDAQSALEAAQGAAVEARRSADALEEANEIARQSLPSDPWELKKTGRHTYELLNASPETLWGVAVIDPGETGDVTLHQDVPVDQLHPNEAVTFTYERSLASPPTTTILISWGFPDAGERLSARRTLST